MSTTQEFKNKSTRNGTILSEVKANRTHGGASIIVSARVKQDSQFTFGNTVYVYGYENNREVFATPLTDTGNWSILPMYSFTPSHSEITIRLIASGIGRTSGELTVAWQQGGTVQVTNDYVNSEEIPDPRNLPSRSSLPSSVMREIKPLSVVGEVWCPSEGSSSIVPIYRRPRNATSLPIGGVSPALNNNMTSVRFI